MASDLGFAALRYAAPPATRLGDTARERGIRTNWATRNLTLANGYNGVTKRPSAQVQRRASLTGQLSSIIALTGQDWSRRSRDEPGCQAEAGRSQATMTSRIFAWPSPSKPSF